MRQVAAFIYLSTVCLLSVMLFAFLLRLGERIIDQDFIPSAYADGETNTNKVHSLGSGVYVLDVRDSNRDINNILGWAPLFKDFADALSPDEEVVTIVPCNVTGHGNMLSVMIYTRKK